MLLYRIAMLRRLSLQLSQINPLISIHLHAWTAMLPSPASWGIAYDD
jgi:hypothetical protein